MLKAVYGFIGISVGKVLANGEHIGVDVDHHEFMEFIINDSGFLPLYSGYKKLRLIALVNNAIGSGEIASAMTSVGLAPKAKKLVAHYSMGIRQRLSIAQALMEGPAILLLDEPMNGLDNASVREMRELFKSLRAKGKTILLASHNPLDIEELCDTACEVDGGVLTRVR